MSLPAESALLAWLASQRSPEMDTLMLAVSWAGSLWLLLPLGLLLALRWRSRVWPAMAALVLASGMCHLLKLMIGRARPDLWPSVLALPPDAAFPSGHATQAMALAVGLVLLLPAGQRAGVGGLLILLALLVGISRLYLQVHWPSDVVAGWLLGAMVAVLVGRAQLRATQ